MCLRCFVIHESECREDYNTKETTKEEARDGEIKGWEWACITSFLLFTHVYRGDNREDYSGETRGKECERERRD